MAETSNTETPSLEERVARIEAALGIIVGAGGVPGMAIPTRIDENEAVVHSLHKLVDDFITEVTIMKNAVGYLSSNADPAGRRVKVPEPAVFYGERNTKELENFVWDMEQYFKAVHVPKEEKVTLTAMYLAKDAKLWWRTRMDAASIGGRPPIEDWEALKRELREQFLPCNSSIIAREELMKLKHQGSVRDYVRKFSSLILDVRNMSEDDKLFFFLAGLRPWAQVELRRQRVADLASAMSAADDLVELRGGYGTDSNKPRSLETGYERRKMEAVKKDAAHPGQPSAAVAGRKSIKCYICSGPHRAKECPKREQLYTLREETEEEAIQYMSGLQLVPDKSTDKGKAPQ